MKQQYLTAFGEVLLYIVGGIVFLVVTFLLSRLIRPDRPNPEKLSTYESGEEPVASAWSQFNIRFYIIALVFLLFEVEIVFLFPWSTVFADKHLHEATDGKWGWVALIEAVIFVLILALGLAYAWAKGHLSWIKPDAKPTEIQSPVPRDLYENHNRKFEGRKPKPHS